MIDSSFIFCGCIESMLYNSLILFLSTFRVDGAFPILDSFCSRFSISLLMLFISSFYAFSCSFSERFASSSFITLSTFVKVAALYICKFLLTPLPRSLRLNYPGAFFVGRLELPIWSRFTSFGSSCDFFYSSWSTLDSRSISLKLASDSGPLSRLKLSNPDISLMLSAPVVIFIRVDFTENSR